MTIAKFDCDGMSFTVTQLEENLFELKGDVTRICEVIPDMPLPRSEVLGLIYANGNKFACRAGSHVVCALLFEHPQNGFSSAFDAAIFQILQIGGQG